MVAKIEATAVDRASTTAQPKGLPGRNRQRKIGFDRNQEPALVDLLTDPIIHRLMRSDGVRQDALIDLIADVKVRLAWQRPSFWQKRESGV